MKGLTMRKIALLCVWSLIFTTALVAQTPTPPAPPSAPPALQAPPPAPRAPQAPPTPRAAPQAPTPMPPRAPGLPANAANVRLDLAITDTYTGAPAKKTVSMIVLSGMSGMIRTSNRLPNGFSVGLNVDAAAQVQSNGVVTVRVTFEYTPAQAPPSAQEPGMAGVRPTQPAELHESLSVMLQDGKPLLVSQSADPATDRKVTVELTATILK
jgi:hypothetical protein